MLSLAYALDFRAVNDMSMLTAALPIRPVHAGPAVFKVLGEKMGVSAGALEARALALAAEAAGLAPSQREPLWQDKQE